jgi:hypothetical protein
MSGGMRMDEEKVVTLLYQLRDEIKVDETLKGNLRKTFGKKRAPIWKKIGMYGVAAAIILVSFLLVDLKPKPVDANSLKITNTLSFYNLGSGEVTAMTHHNGNLYLSFDKKGIFIYTSNGLEKISEETATDLSIDASGENVLFSANGSVAILDLKTNKKKMLLDNSNNTRYSHPVWKDSQTIFVTKESGNKQEMIEWNLQNQKEQVVVEGKNPSYFEKNQQLVFERDGKVILKEKGGPKKIVDSGTEPSISQDGHYIAYVKESNGIEDVWVKDIDLKTDRKVTTNLDTNGYHYFSPVWSSTDRGLFVLKQRSTGPAQMMKIDLGEKELDAQQTVNRFLQALIVRDDDYAKTMMKTPPEILTISNPHQTGYQILSSGKEKDGVVHVQAEVTWSYTANPYYKMSTYDFELMHGENGYVISQVTELKSKELKPEVNTDHIQLIEGDKKETLFSISDIPKKMLKDSHTRLASLALDPNENKILFTIQEVRDDSNQATVNLISYDRKSKSFTFIDRIDSIDGHKNIGVSGMSLSGSGKYAALDLFIDEPPYSAHVYVYYLQEGKQLKQLNQTHTYFWQDNQLLLEKIEEDQSTILQRFDPAKGVK